VFALDLASGREVWSVGAEPDHVDDPGADWEKGGAIQLRAVHESMLVIARDDGTLQGIDLRTGNLRWSVARAAPSFGRLSLKQPWLALSQPDSELPIHLLDAATGRDRDLIKAGGRRPIEDMKIAFDGMLLVATSKIIQCFEVESGRLRWTLELAGTYRSGSLTILPDGIVVADSDRQLQKVGFEDGRKLWISAPAAEEKVPALHVEVSGELLLVLTTSSVAAIDSATGLTVWVASVPDNANLVHHLLTERYIAAVQSPRNDSGKCVVYFYDLKTGRIPDGGIVSLKDVESIDSIQAVNGALLIETGDLLYVYAPSEHSLPPPP
jgi:outer membrane protein assembly factor BamB